MKTRTQRHICQCAHEHDGRTFSIHFRPDGLHVREKYARQEKVLTLDQLVGNGQPEAKPSAERANPKYPDGSIAEVLDMAACDLCVLADQVHRKAHDKTALAEVHRSVNVALRKIRALEEVV